MKDVIVSFETILRQSFLDLGAKRLGCLEQNQGCRVFSGFKWVAFLLRKDDKTVQLRADETQLLLESLKYSVQRVSDAPGTPYPVRQENLKRLYCVQEKVRQMGKTS